MTDGVVEVLVIGDLAPEVAVILDGGAVGRRGATGATGAAGNDNLFIGPTAPVTALDQYLWVETSADEGTVVTFWVET